MIKPDHCAKEEALVLSVQTAGLDEVRISRADDGEYIMSVKVKTRRERYYLATRRTPDEPRKFKKIESAVALAERLFGAKRFLLTV